MHENRTTLAVLAAAIVLVAGLTSGAGAITRLDATYGTPTEGETARSAAMGSVGVADLQGSSSAVQNPALLAAFAGRAHLDFQIGVRQVNEDRFVPLYDTFDDLVAETAYAINRDTYAAGQGGLIYRLPTEITSVLAVGLFERYDTEWNYGEEVRSATTDDLQALRDVESDGRLRSWTVAFGTEVLDAASIGLAVHRYFGTFEDVARVAPVSGAESLTRLSRDLAGWGWTVGASVQAGPRLTFGAAFEGPFKVDGSHVRSAATGGTPTPLVGVPDDGDYEVEYPASVSFGMSLRPRNELRTVFSLEARYRWWEELRDRYVEAEVALAADDAAAAAAVPFASPARNTWDFRGGVEHRFYNDMPLRFGFRYFQNYADRDTERIVFSAGTGYRLGPLSIDLTGQYHRQTSRQDFVFDEGASGIANPLLLPKVEDGVIRFVLGVSRGF